MLVLLPPSEGKATPRRGAPLDLDHLAHPDLGEARRKVLDALVGLCAADPEHASAVLGLGPTQLDEVRRNAGLRDAPTARADTIYTGVLYDALDLASLAASSRRRATRSLLIVSALFGVVGPADRIPSYRLSGGVTLPALGAVAAHWRRALDSVVTEAAGSGLVVDLRSSTYAGFWRPSPAMARQVAVVRVLQEAGGRRSVVSHSNKATKGRLARSLLESSSSPRTPDALAATLGDLGWQVEVAPPGRHGCHLDVVVRHV